MVETKRLDPQSQVARALMGDLDSHLRRLYPAESCHLDPVEELAQSHVRFLGAFEGDKLVGCGAVKLLAEGYGEIKRMYVSPEARGKGAGRTILLALEFIAARARIPILRPETGVHQHEAIQLYRRHGFTEIGPFGDYSEDPLSLYMEKRVPC
jgi:putative acetyltransferase